MGWKHFRYEITHEASYVYATQTRANLEAELQTATGEKRNEIQEKLEELNRRISDWENKQGGY
jgi:hypothetical protein